MNFQTHTMEGVNEPSELRGIIPNTFEHIFDYIALNGSKDKYLVRASYFEIYNEEIRDLLSSKPHVSLELKESPDTGVYVKDLTSTTVKSVEEIDKVLQKGKKNRMVGSTLMNAGSSRSHSVFTIVIECCSSDEQGEHIRVGKLNLVDLAGSERQSKTGATGDRLKEATKINLSLSALGNVISALVDGKSQHIPYRDSKLTRILQDSLGGNTKTVMCANAGPADYNYDESLSTLRYANRAKNIKNKPVINEDPKDAMLREYQEEIARLKERLSQMPTSSSPAMGEQEKETIIDEVRSKANKENEALRAKTNAELQKLKSANHQTAEERERLAKKLAEEKQAHMDTENQKLQLRRQLKEMEAKLVVGGEFANTAKKQEAELRRANQELALKVEQELALNRRMAEQEEEKLHLEERYGSLSDEVQSKTKKLKKLWAKYQQAKTEIQDLEREFLIDKNETVDTIRDLTKQLKLKEFIISSFVPPKVRVPATISSNIVSPLTNHSFLASKYALLYDAVENGGRAVYDEAREAWTIPGIKTHNGGLRDRRQSMKMSEYVELDIEMPVKTTLDIDNPNTLDKISSILTMDLNDHLEEIPCKYTNRQDKMFRIDHVSARISLCK
jgi:myosin heavy subunit